MPRIRDWRSSSAADELNHLDRAGLAWEFLRRNPRYRRDYSKLSRDTADEAATAAGERWGLCFRLQSRPPGRICADGLAAGAAAHQRCPGFGAR
ncbi:transcriptional regulator domain-containing protein [Dongia deserti]|uniref:transcriptional regulator domain-containing protein n=1 Tax=Dongia deserti TaxID=2268030 RepID=UPI002547ADE1|nr:DUF6499 domain-containing protein [Dongia deserti]